MAKRKIYAGVADQTVDVFIQDSSSTTGAGLAGLVYNTAGLSCYYRKGATGTATALSLATQTVGGAHSDGGFVEIQSTNMKGLYRLDLSDTMVAATPWVTIYLYGAANMAPLILELEVVAYNPFDGVRLGLTALPNAVPAGNGGLPTVDASNQVAANVTQISGDSTAADNLELQFDATGISGDTYPATQAQAVAIAAQISAIGSGTGAALNYAVSEDNASTPIKSVTAVGTQTGTFANTLADDGTVHQLASVGNAIDWVYGFSCGVAKAASKFVFRANMSTTGDTVTVQAYNFTTMAWDTRTTVTGTAETLRDVPLLSVHTGLSGADAGKVFIRFVYAEGDAGTLVIDEAYVQAQQSGSLIGYADGAVWVKATGTAASVPYINGTADNPCPWANAQVIAGLVGLSRFRIVNGETVTLTADCINKSLIGKNWTLELGGQNISDSFFEGAKVSGIASGSESTPPVFEYCGIGTVTLPGCLAFQCGIGRASGTFTATGGTASQYNFIDCFSLVPGSGTPIFTFVGGTTSRGINIRRWSGGTNITLDSICTLSLEVSVGGGQTISLNGADVEIRGITRSITLTNITTDTTAQIDCVTGPISLAGADGTVNIYGVCGAVTDSRTGTPLGTRATALNTVNLATPTDVTNAVANVSVDEIQASALEDIESSVKAKVVEALATDTYGEPGQEEPAAINTLVKKIGYLFKFLRNKQTLNKDTGEFKTFADDGVTVDHKGTNSDDGTTFTKGKIGTGA